MITGAGRQTDGHYKKCTCRRKGKERYWEIAY